MNRTVHFAWGIVCIFPLHSESSTARAQCDVTNQIQNHSATTLTPCTCLIAGEQAGVVLDASAEDYPIEILRVGIGWFSQFGGAPDTIEQGIHIYQGALPDPGMPIFTLPGPVLSDGSINEFDLEPLPGRIVVDQGSFTVTLEFQNTNNGNIFAPSVAYDSDGCQSAKNVVFVDPDGWVDACAAGVPGDWAFYVKYRRHCIPADTNCDDKVDGLDVARFVKAVLETNCSIAAADVNESGSEDEDDIVPFVDCLLAGGCP